MDNLRIYNVPALISDAAAKVEIDTETGEITGGDDLEALLKQGEEKILSCGRYLSMRGKDLEAMKEHVKSMQARIKAEERSQAWLKSCMIRAIRALNTTSVEDSDILVKLKKCPPSVFIEDETKIPDCYIVREVKEIADKKAILADLKAGKEVAGCSMTNSLRLDIK